jgi:hypothetical protein
MGFLVPKNRTSSLTRIMHTLDSQERQDERNMMGPRKFRASATTEPPKQTAR